MHHKAIAVAMTAITSVWLLRVSLTGTIFYGFVVWNILLAVIPLYVERLFPIIRVRLHGVTQKAGQLLTAAVWLLFLPNAFYILTDFMHLNPDVLVNARDDNYRYATEYVRGDSLYMLDSLLVFLGTVFGAYVGGLALLHAYRYFQKHTSRFKDQSIILGIMLLAGLGVYIGRFGRWNSWDALIFPHHVLGDIWQTLTTSAVGRERILIMMLSMLIFQIASLAGVAYYQKTKILSRS